MKDTGLMAFPVLAKAWMMWFCITQIMQKPDWWPARQSQSSSLNLSAAVMWLMENSVETCCLVRRTRALTCTAVLFGEQVVCQRRGVGETLHRGVEEAGVPQVMEAGAHSVHALPFQGELVPREKQFLRRRDPVALTAEHVLWNWTFYIQNTHRLKYTQFCFNLF